VVVVVPDRPDVVVDVASGDDVVVDEPEPPTVVDVAEVVVDPS
jgi:hypothetical protein